MFLSDSFCIKAASKKSSFDDEFAGETAADTLVLVAACAYDEASPAQHLTIAYIEKIGAVLEKSDTGQETLGSSGALQ